jgi:hypothetical protein
MGVYSVYIHLNLLESVPSTGKQRELIMRIVHTLSEGHDTPGDFTDQDKTLRVRQIKIVGDYAITYWVDHAAKSVMVVGVRSADK